MRTRTALIACGEVAGSVALATAAVAALQTSAPVAGLAMLYLLAVLSVAIRRGERAGLLTALLSVLTFNYLFITPRHQLSIAHSQDLVELGVLMIAALVVGRLAAVARARAAEAERRAGEADAREREARLLAEVASAILAGRGATAQLEAIGGRIARAVGAARARVSLLAVPDPADDEAVIPLPTRTRTVWLYVTRDAGVVPDADLARLAEPLGRLIDVALERERVAEQAADTEAARRADTARTAILHAISHDLRSPLTAITTAGSALRAEVTDAEHAELLDVIGGEGARLAKLVGDLLDLSRIEAGAVEPQTDWCDLADVVASALATLRPEHPIELSFPADLPLVRADAAQLERVFANLIENAVKFSPPAVPVAVAAVAAGGRVTVRVVDQGAGIPGPERARVFEPFFRGRRRGAGRTGQPGSGSGLGLAICRGFVEANGGQIMLAGDRGRGTAFTVSFPAAPTPAQVGEP